MSLNQNTASAISNRAKAGENRSRSKENATRKENLYSGVISPSSSNKLLSNQFRRLSRRQSSIISTYDLPVEKSARGVCTPAGIFFFTIKLTVPLAYIYIALVLLRELYLQFSTVNHFLGTYVPFLANFLSKMQNVSKLVEIWAIIEGVFYICLNLHLRWLQYQDPLEASLNCAPMLELHERQLVWDRIMDSESDDPVSFLTGWFFDEKLENITKYDVLDFVTWSMFDGRNQEHLARDELEQLDSFVEDLERRISVHLYGYAKGEDESLEVTEAPKLVEGVEDETKLITNESDSIEQIPPRKFFQFHMNPDEAPPTFFTQLYENYKHKYEHYRHTLEKADFHPIQDFREFVAKKTHQILNAEESAMSTASHMYENAYFALIDKGSNVDKQLTALSSNVDKQLTALSQATHTQLNEAWSHMSEIKEWLEKAKFITARKKSLMQQQKGYQLLLDRMRLMSSGVPSYEMADLMRKISQCHDAINRIESSAVDTFTKATGFARKNLIQGKEPQRFAKYSGDPLLGVSTSYPLVFHLFILLVTEGGLRLLMKMRGFERRTIGKISYYYHPGTGVHDDELFMDTEVDEELNPIVFIHGIGVGLIYYINLIDRLLEHGRPMFLPEIPYVTGFRNWLSPNSILTPAAVASTLTAMLASHGFLKATFIGHSYGTSWLSYMCKLAPSAMEGVLFIDPICFCLHIPFLTKQFVYHRADPGSTSYMIRTDVIVNWAIQRGFPWVWISLFVEDLAVPCVVFLSDQDTLVPATKVEKYLSSKGGLVRGYKDFRREHVSENRINVVLLPGVGHGDWVDYPSMMQKITLAVESLQTSKPPDGKELDSR